MEALFAASVLGASLVIALALHPALTRVVKYATQKTKTTLDDLLLEAISRPLFIFIVVQGVFLALTTVSYLDRWQDYVNKAWVVFAGGTTLYGVQRISNAFVQWYGTEITSRTRGKLDDKLIPLVRRFLTVVLYAVGGLLILDNLGIRLSPLLAGLGIGGLAVALAIQPTLSSVIASAYMVADGMITVGDFIEVQNGPSGTVLDIGWRSTKIRTPINNLVIIPNGKLADSVVTNFTAQNPEVTIFVECGVSYESDLGHVEQIALEEARQLLHVLPDTVVAKDFEPFFLFSGFGDSNINFWVGLRARNRGSTFKLTHELVKRLHARFAKEGIEINYPVRKLVVSPQNASDLSTSLETILETKVQEVKEGITPATDDADSSPKPQ
ncbi:MAG: mechanosensitive ion channel family protein [Chloroflexi bacterium]|nr:mechanosensitive ion channel family protein [Chloroflexota bacterium]